MKKNILFGRNTHLELLERRIRSFRDGYRQNIAIIGDELVGKSSVIFEFLNNFSDVSIVMLYLEIRPEPLILFSRRLIGALLYNFLINSGIPLREDLDFLIENSARYIPRTVEKIRQLLNSLNKRKKNNVFSELLGLCEIFHEETGKSCVLVFDEFHNLEGLGVNKIYQEWARILVSQKNTMYIIISSLQFKAKAILAKNLSLLFGNFEVVEVLPLDIRQSMEFLDYKLGGFKLNNVFKDFIVYFSAGYPLYIEAIANAILSGYQGRLADIIERLLFDASGLLNQRFSNYMKRFLDLANSNEYILLLYLISNGRNKLRDAMHLLHKPKKDILSRINRLLEMDAVTRCGDFLKINDRVFSLWVKFVYQGKLESLTFDARNQKDKLRDDIEDMIKEFQLNSQKPMIERVSEVLRLFEDEVMQVEKKKIRLNHFREIKPVEFNSQNLKEGLIGRSSESLWIIGFKYGQLNEEDIVEFSRECRKFRSKLQRKIIVTIGEINTNARLKALEEKIWPWGLNSLNQLFDLFSRPGLISCASE